MFESVVFFLSMIIEGIASLIILTAVCISAFRAAQTYFTPKGPFEVRLALGRWLALSLEFLLAADILRTAVAPSWEELGKLAAIIVLRTVLNFFLEMEIRNSERAIPKTDVRASS
jgi:uncharacterized membrane protein